MAVANAELGTDAGAKALLLELQMMEGAMVFHKDQARKYKYLYEQETKMNSEDLMLERKVDTLELDILMLQNNNQELQNNNQGLQNDNTVLVEANEELKHDKAVLLLENEEVTSKLLRLEQELAGHIERERQQDNTNADDKENEHKAEMAKVEQMLEETLMSLEEEQAAKRKAEAQLDNEQGKVQKLMMVVAKLQAIQSEKATSAAPFCTSTIQGSCKSKVGGENQAAKRQQTQMEQLRTSMKERKQTTALTNTVLAVATAESAFQLWKSAGEVETGFGTVRNITTEDGCKAEGADNPEVLKRLQRFKKDNFRMKVQRVEFNNMIAQLTQEKQELEEVVADYETDITCLQQENVTLKHNIIEHKEFLGDCWVFLDDAQAQVLALKVQVAAARAEAAFDTQGWGKCEDVPGAESVCSSNSTCVQDCEESLSESPSSWSLTSSPAQPSTPEGSRRCSIAGSKPCSALPAGSAPLVKAPAGVRSRIPAAPASVLEAVTGVAKAGTVSKVPTSSSKAAVPAGATGKATSAGASKMVSTPRSVAGAAAAGKGLGRKGAAGGEPYSGSSSSRAQVPQARSTGDWRR